MAEQAKGKVRVHADIDVLYRAAAGVFTQTARKSVASKGRFSVALSGGKTPLGAYKLLSQSPYRELVAWGKTHVFWGDERCVPRDDDRNNARSAMEALLRHVPIPKSQIHPIPTEQPPEKAAEQYEALLRKFFRDGAPRFDLILLGLGEDGHTASLFPGSPVLDERDRWVKEVYVQEGNMFRVTLTVPAIVEAEAIVFLAQGSEKAEALKKVVQGPYRPQELPAQLIRPKHGELVWLVDDQAAHGLQDA